MNSLDFVSCHNHTEMSNLRNSDSIMKVEAAIDRSYELGHKAICITDHESVSSFVRANRHYYKRYKDTDFKVILGNEIYLVEDVDKLKEEGGKHHHFLLLAKNLKGNKQLRQLSSQSWSNYFVKAVERVPISYTQIEDIIGEEKGNLIASTACLGGYFAQEVLCVLSENEEAKKRTHKLNIDKFIKWCVNIFGKENFFIELQASQDEEQIAYNKYAITIANAYKLKYIITTDSHMESKMDKGIHSAFLNSDKENTDKERDSFYQYAYMMSVKEMWEVVKDHLTIEEFTTATANTMDIYNMCEMYDLYKPVTIPKCNIPNFEIKHILRDYYNDYPFIDKFASSKHEQDRLLLHLIEEGVINKNIQLDDTIIDRLNYELKHYWGISKALGQRMSGYMNITKELIDFIWNYSFVAPGRGSIGGSYVAFLLDIIQYPPIDKTLNLDLKAWRFCHEDRPDMMDIDIDLSPTKRPLIFKKLKEKYGYNNVMQICTYTTLGAKASIKAVCRGRGINSDEADAMASLIKMERGSQWSISDSLYGNEEKDRKPNRELVNLVAKYDGLEEAIVKLEGLIVARSSHAAGVFLYDNGYIEAGNSVMITPGGIVTTVYDLHESEHIGNMKFDCLVTDSIDKLMITMDLLEKDGLVENQGSLRATYNKYLHPYYALDFNNPIIWNVLHTGEILDIFQFQTDLAVMALKKTKPTNILQLAQLNSLMRLSTDDIEQPIDKFLRYKADISEWYKDMNKYNLTKDEISIMEEHLLHLNGICENQETLMALSQDVRISNFSVGDSNKLRKIIAKKRTDELESMYEYYIEKGKEANTRVELLDYIWKEQFSLSFNYSFNLAHTFFYSLIALQQLNLCTKYPIIYWNTATLISNSGSVDIDKEGATTDYGRVAKGLGDLINKQNVKVSLPDINRAEFRFSPDASNNEILYGLFAISKVNKDIANTIIYNRPYASLNDFLSKTRLTNEVMTNLIKAGCFDSLEGDRISAMKRYLNETISGIKNLGTNHILTLVDKFNSRIETITNNSNLETNTKEYNYTLQTNTNMKNIGFETNTIRLLKYRSYIFNKKFQIAIENAPKSKSFYLLDAIAEDFFRERLMEHCTEGKHYFFTEDGLVVSKNDFDKVYKTLCKEILDWAKTEEAITLYKELLVKEAFDDIYTSIPHWEITSLNYYYTGHVLDSVDLETYGVEDFYKQPEEPSVKEKTITKTGREFIKYETIKIAGTLVHKDMQKHLIYILTPTGIVSVKFRNAGKYAFYNKQISKLLESGKKKVLDKSWFARHTNLIIEGYREGEQFICTTYNQDSHSVMRISEIQDNNIWLDFDRVRH